MGIRIEQLQGHVRFWEKNVEAANKKLLASQTGLERARAALQAAQEEEGEGGLFSERMPGTVDGIRPHKHIAAEEAAQMKAAAELPPPD